MTMILFEDKDSRGRSLSVARNLASLKDTTIGNNPSSIRMGEGDAILLYKKEDWNGGVMFLRGGADVSNLGSAKDGGRASWISSWSTALIPAMSAWGSSHGGAMSPSSR